MTTTEFQPWPKIGRLNKAMMTITEKIDGTNAQVHIFQEDEDVGFPIYRMRACSRNKTLNEIVLRDGKFESHTGHSDNYGFAAWVLEECEELFKLGEGRHYGEWWGQGIQRGYVKEGRFFSLFNARRWTPMFYAAKEGRETNFPSCCGVVPILHQGPFDQSKINEVFDGLRAKGSVAVPGFMNPEGIIIHFEDKLYKMTYEHGDGKWAA